MADYVRKTILSQSYVHLERKTYLTAEEKSDFEITLSDYQRPRAKIMLGANIQPEVRTEDGSLIVYATVYGSVADALGGFVDFHKSINNLYNSSRMLADACILESMFLARSGNRQLIRSESRTGVVRAIKDLFDRVQILGGQDQQESVKRLSSSLGEIEKKTLFLNNQLVFGRDKELVWSNFLPLLKRLNGNLRHLQKTPDQIQLNLYRDLMRDLMKRVSDFQKEGDIQQN